MEWTRRNFLKLGLALFLAAGTFSLATLPFRAAEPLPERLTAEEFWQLIVDFSEAGGYFRFENFLSNELGFQYVIPRLKAVTRPGGVYLGVGPEQNFTYVVALEPKIAFIFDIRRQNMLEHLMYKALFELSQDRAEFLSRLYARRRPPALGANSSPEALFGAYTGAPHDPDLVRSNIAAFREILVKRHRFGLSEDDLANIEYVYGVFVDAGPFLDYTAGGGGGSASPTYADLMTATDETGKNWSFLATEENFRFIRQMQLNHLIVPLVGDFAGPRAIRSVGQYVKDHGATITAFYLSNVEQYLFQQSGDWRRFYLNAGALPLDSSSTFIRSVNGRSAFRRFGGINRFQTLLSPMAETVKAFEERKIRVYNDVINMSAP